MAPLLPEVASAAAIAFSSRQDEYEIRARFRQRAGACARSWSITTAECSRAATNCCPQPGLGSCSWVVVGLEAAERGIGGLVIVSLYEIVGKKRHQEYSPEVWCVLGIDISFVAVARDGKRGRKESRSTRVEPRFVLRIRPDGAHCSFPNLTIIPTQAHADDFTSSDPVPPLRPAPHRRPYRSFRGESDLLSSVASRHRPAACASPPLHPGRQRERGTNTQHEAFRQPGTAGQPAYYAVHARHLDGLQSPEISSVSSETRPGAHGRRFERRSVRRARGRCFRLPICASLLVFEKERLLLVRPMDHFLSVLLPSSPAPNIFIPYCTSLNSCAPS